MSNQNIRLAKRGGHRIRKAKYLEIPAEYIPINTGTKQPSKAKDQDGNYIIERTDRTERPAQKGKSFYYDKPATIVEIPVYKSLVRRHTIRVRVA